MISNELNLFKRVWIRGMERLCIRGMDQYLKWAAAIWVPMDTPSLDMSGHTAGRPNRWLPLTGSRDRLRPPDEVMLIIIPNRAYHEPNNWDGAWHWVYNISRKPIFYLEWMCEHWGDCLSQERGIVTSLTKKLAGVCTEKLEYPEPTKVTLRMMGFQFQIIRILQFFIISR